ncbi:GNAT family N-acetyltransferase [Gymnodinialimonas sp. 2305UL16-5]|uniref:GNAT family N-acetyltransferase n=1 Tax=Gymnodinialimonas mytili TaxID=3126503 RepID=UPI0030AB7CBD
MSHDIDVFEAAPTSSVALALLQAAHDAMKAHYPRKWDIEFDPRSFALADASIFLACLSGKAVGCCALFLRPDFAELKKLHVAPASRGFGVAEALVGYAEAFAQATGSRKIMLESGARLHAAHRLYSRLGYQPCGAFGTHTPDPDSCFFEKDLQRLDDR